MLSPKEKIRILEHKIAFFFWQTSSPLSDVKTFTKYVSHREQSKQITAEPNMIMHVKHLAQELALHKCELSLILLTILKKHYSTSQL